MSNLSIVNKAIPRASGMGLPFYTNPNNIFSIENPDFNSTNGLWIVPRDKVPTFQLHVPKVTPNPWNVTAVEYFETRGNGDYTGYIVALPTTSVKYVRAAKKDGSQIYIYQTDWDYVIPSPPRCGRWVLRIHFSEGGANIFYYSEEFITIDFS